MNAENGTMLTCKACGAVLFQKGVAKDFKHVCQSRQGR